MKRAPPPLLENSRSTFAEVNLLCYNSKSGEMAGAFQLLGPLMVPLKLISSGHDLIYKWEHVSVTVKALRNPTWVEMCFVKNLFWDEHEVVMQIHPAKSDYINHHPYCLHLWKPIGAMIPTPPSILVGPKGGAPNDLDPRRHAG